MKNAIQKAAVLIEALPYIQQFRGAIVVVKLGGSVMEDESHMKSILTDVTFMGCVGMRPVIVHGGGKAISRGMAKEGIEPNFVKGLRVTCDKTIDVVERVINGEVNPAIVATMTALGCRARGVRGQDVFHVVRKTEVDKDTGKEFDWGFVGVPGEVHTGPVRECTEHGIIPVITPLGIGPDGKTHNINADTAAAAMAKALKAGKLALISDVPGLLKDPEDENTVMDTLRVQEAEDLVTEGVVAGGMLPKVRGGIEALHGGVSKVHLIDGRMQHSLLLEIFTREGVGTQIVQD